MRAIFSPEFLQAGAVKGLNMKLSVCVVCVLAKFDRSYVVNFLFAVTVVLFLFLLCFVVVSLFMILILFKKISQFLCLCFWQKQFSAEGETLTKQIYSSNA